MYVHAAGLCSDRINCLTARISYAGFKGGSSMKVAATMAEKITVTLVGRDIIPESDAGLYRYGIENGITVAGNLLASLIFGLVTGRLGNILVFLFFYGTLRSFSGGIHCKGRTGCFIASILVLFIPAYLCDWAVKIPFVAVVIGGITAAVVILALSPMESINKPLDDGEWEYCRRMSRCIAGWQVCTLVTLYCMDRLDYFYAGYSGLVLVAVFLIAGKMATKFYT